MRWKRCVGFGLAAFLGGTLSAEAQTRVSGGPSLILPPQPIAQSVTIVPGSDGQTSGAVDASKGSPASSTKVKVVQYAAPAQPAPGTRPGAASSSGAAAPGSQSAAPGGGEGAFSPGSTGAAADVPGTRLEMEAEQAGQPEEPKLGPAPVDQVKFLQNFLFGEGESKLKVYGWFDSGYTYRTTGPGQTFVAPVMNRFGDEYTFNQIAIRIEKPLDPKDWSWGFNMQPYGGADPALLNPTRGAIIRHPDDRFGFDFSDLNLTAHLPILTEGGIDIKAGRQTTVVGSQAAQAPWRTFYSSDYQWFFAEEGRFTGVTANWHVTKQLDFLIGYEHGWGTFFANLSEGPTLISQINYWLQPEKKTLFTVSVETGPEQPDHGSNTTLVELRVTQNWNKYWTQILQSHLLYSQNGIGGLGLERAYGVYLYNIYHMTKCVDTNFRIEWYDDVDGHGYPGGTGFKNNYVGLTGGIDYHPNKWLQVRPEIRGDFADKNAAFGASDNPKKFKDQLSLACDFLVKF